MKHRRGFTNLSYLSPLQRRRALRRLQQHKVKLRLARVCGVITGLSVTSLCLANSAQGTHAMFTAQETKAVTLSAAKDFPKYDNQIAQQAQEASQAACADEQKLLQAVSLVQNAPTSSDAEALLGNVESLAQQVQTDLAEANQFKSQIDAIANRDLQDYQNAKLDLQNSQQTLSQTESSIHQIQDMPLMSVQGMFIASSSENLVNSVLPEDTNPGLLEQSLQSAESISQNLQEIADSYKRVVGWSSAADKRAADAIEGTKNLTDPSFYITAAQGIIAQKQAAEAAAAAAAAAASSDSSGGSAPSSSATTGDSSGGSAPSSSATTGDSSGGGAPSSSAATGDSSGGSAPSSSATTGDSSGSSAPSSGVSTDSSSESSTPSNSASTGDSSGSSAPSSSTSTGTVSQSGN
jgi:hypothetical protein